MASFSVVSNISAVNAQANLAATNLGLQKTLQRLSSGFRINSSGDDAAGLAVANTYRSQVAVLNQGMRNANDGLSTLQIQDGALNNTSTLLDRMAVLASQSASARSSVDRAVLDAEFRTSCSRSIVKRRSPGSTRPRASRCSSAATAPMASSAARSGPSTRPRSASARSTSPRRPTRRRPWRPSRRRCRRSAPCRARSAPSRTGCPTPSASPRSRSSARRRPRAGFATPTWPRSRRT